MNALLVTAASTAINYSDSCVELLAEGPEINLRHQLNVLLDPKYKSQTDWDDRYNEAKEAAQMTLSMLKDEAKDKEAEVKTIVETLLTVNKRSLSHSSAAWLPFRLTNSSVQDEHNAKLG